MKLSYKNHLFLILLCLLPALVTAQIVRIETDLGNIDIELSPEAAPITVTNFLAYVNRGDYNASIIHRSANNADTQATFIIQGGGLHFRDGELVDPIPADPAIVNEFSLLNERGTIAMAKIGGSPDSATSQWFINTTDNPSLDSPDNSGGFTVFGHVIAGMGVVDLIGSIRTWNKGGSLASVPLIGFPGGDDMVDDYTIQVSSMEVFEPSFSINAGHNGAWFNQNTPGQGILFEVLPETNLVFMAWFTFDTVAPPEDIEAIVGAPEHRWLTGLGEIDHETNTIVFDLALTTGGLFDNAQAVMNSTPNSYGTLTAQINNCTDIDVSYDLTEQELTGDFSMVRISDDNVALCEMLSEQ